ncbi:hypothetical protein, partial [Clostridium perfringens]
ECLNAKAGPTDPGISQRRRPSLIETARIELYRDDRLETIEGALDVLEQSRKRLLCYGVRAPAAERDTPHLSASADMGGNKI